MGLSADSPGARRDTNMRGNARAWFSTPLAAMIGALLMCGAAPPKAVAPPKAAPRPKTATPTGKAKPRASAEPAEAQLPPVDPAWRQHGWHAVVPHAYVIRGRAAARLLPEPEAPAAFWLKGGARVPILEQRRHWW